MKKVYINPQWQGGADLSTFHGVEELKKNLTGPHFLKRNIVK